jgi:hypothetical protein
VLTKRPSMTLAGGSANVAQVAKQARRTLSAANSAAAALTSRRAYLLDLLAPSLNAAGLIKRVSVTRLGASPNVADASKRVAASRSVASPQVGDVTKTAVKTFSAANGAAASFTTGGRTIVLRGSSVQVALLGRFVSSVRLALSTNVGIRRVALPKVFVAASSSHGDLAITTIPLSFKLTRSALRIGGDVEAVTSIGESGLLKTYGESGRLVSGGRSGTLTTTGK